MSDLSQVLNWHYQNPPSFRLQRPIARKLLDALSKTLHNHDNHLILTTPLSGCTTTLLHLTQKLDRQSFLYIDLSDEVFANHCPQDIAQAINAYATQTPQIQILIIEHLKAPIGSTIKTIISTSFEHEDNFKDHWAQRLYAYPLDFEEFLSLQNRHYMPSYVFASFTRQSSFPNVLSSDPPKLTKAMQHQIKLITAPHTKNIFKAITPHQGLNLSLHQIYTTIKQAMPLSKDKLYATIAHLVKQRLIFLIPKYNQPKAPKKLYFIDHALPKATTLQNNPRHIIANIFLLELLKPNTNPADITYTNELSFYNTRTRQGYIISLFEEIDAIKTHIRTLHTKLTKAQTPLKDITVITINEDQTQDKIIDTIITDHLTYTITTVWEFALSKNDESGDAIS